MVSMFEYRACNHRFNRDRGLWFLQETRDKPQVGRQMGSKAVTLRGAYGVAWTSTNREKRPGNQASSLIAGSSPAPPEVS